MDTTPKPQNPIAHVEINTRLPQPSKADLIIIDDPHPRPNTDAIRDAVLAAPKATGKIVTTGQRAKPQRAEDRKTFPRPSKRQVFQQPIRAWREANGRLVYSAPLGYERNDETRVRIDEDTGMRKVSTTRGARRMRGGSQAKRRLRARRMGLCS